MVVSRAVDHMGKRIDGLLYASIYLTGLILVTMAAITGYEVVSRYVFNVPTIWTSDLAIFLLIVSTFLSMGYLQSQGKHVNVDLYISHFSPRTKIIWDVVTGAVSLVFASALTYYGAIYAYGALESHEYSWSMWRVVTWPVKLAIPLGGVLLVVQLVREIIFNYQTVKDTPSEKYLNPFTNPFFAIPVFLFLLALSGYLYTVNGAAGMVLLMLVLLFAGVPIYSALGLVGTTGYFIVFGGSDFVSASLPATAFRSLGQLYTGLPAPVCHGGPGSAVQQGQR